MTLKTLKILTFIPVLNLFVIIYCFIKRFTNSQAGKAIAKILIWVGIMIAFAIVRAIATVIFSNLPIVVDIITYITLYISVTLGALLHISDLSEM